MDALSQTLMSKESTPIQKVSSVPTVTLVITSPEGRVQGFLSGDCAVMANLLAMAAWSSSEPNSPVKTSTDSFLQPGQTVYEVDRDFVMASRANLTFLPWTTIQQLDQNLPTSSKLFFVVSY